MFSNIFQKYIENSEQVFEDGINQLEDFQKKRDEELIKFIDEFIVSEEYADYVQNKRSINKECKMVQYDENDFINYQVNVEEKKYPLTADSKKMFTFTKHFQKYVERKENQEVVKRQERGIQIIKDRISELKLVLMCTREKKLVQNEEQNKQYLEMFCNSFNIDYSSIKLKNKTKVEERIICYQKILHSRNIKRKLNIKTIVKKLTEEYTRTREKKKIRIPFYGAQTQKLSEGEIFRFDVGNKHIYQSEDVMSSVVTAVEDTLEEPLQIKHKDNNSKTKDQKKSKIRSTTKSSKKSKKSSKKDSSALVLPVVPLCNKRNKINTEVMEKISKIMEEFRKFDDVMEDTHMLSKESSSEDLKIDADFLCKPEAIEFNLKNEGKKPCKAVIKKIFDPLELSEPVIGEEENPDVSYDFAKNIVEELFENVFNIFSFESSFIKLDDLENFKLEIKLRNVDHVGDYFEKYMFDIYEDEDRTGSQELVVSAEVTGHFIELSPTVLDFGVCILNSIYQIGLEIYNRSSGTQTIAVKFPSSVVDYIKADVSNLYVPSQTRRTIWLKFHPRKHILTELMPYFDESTRVLEFPVHVCVLSRNYSDIPPVKASIFAVVTDQNNTNVIPTNDEFCDYFPDGAVLNLGECSIYETVSTDIIIENDTSSPQIYGFIDLPQCLTISPNFGFGELGPGDRKTLKMFYHPTIENIKDFGNEGKLKDYRIVLKINVETLSNVGQTKQILDCKKLRKSIELVIKELRNPVDNNLVEDMKLCMESIKSKNCSQRTVNNEISQVLFEYKGEGYGEFGRIPRSNALMKERTSKRSQLILHAKIIRPLLQLSCQHVEFPDTPCGSYSTTEIELEALTKENASKCDFFKDYSKLSLPKYEAWFKITGDNNQIRVEPSCGILTNGQIKKIVLIAKPATQDDIIKDTAKSIKYSEIYEMKKHEIELARSHSKVKKKSEKEKRGGKGGKKEKKQKKNKKKGTEIHKESNLNDGAKIDNAIADITVTEEEMKLSYLDYYPAEMCYWRSLEPYTIKSELTCNINYDSPNMIRKQETLHLDVFCKVTKPDFISNLKQQRINFGTVAVGMISTEYVILQNINYSSIEPVISLLNPVGPFKVPFMKNIELPPENYWKLPIKFEPVLAEKVEEYFEISSGKTILPLILEGTGITPEIEFKPNFLVYRLDTKINTIAECTLEIANKCGAAVTINFEKVLDLEGFITAEPRQKDTKTSSGTQKNEVEKKSKKKKADKEKKSDRSKKSVSSPKFSDVLTDVEETSIRNNFNIRKGESFFGILNIEEDQVNLPENSTKIIKLGFGTPEALLKRKREMKEKSKKAKKEKTVKDKGSSGKSKDSKKGTVVTYYVVKYNIKLSNSFVRDIIFICNFK